MGTTEQIAPPPIHQPPAIQQTICEEPIEWGTPATRELNAKCDTRLFTFNVPNEGRHPFRVVAKVEGEEVEVSLVSQDNRRLNSTPTGGISINIPDLQPGNYAIQVTTETTSTLSTVITATLSAPDHTVDIHTLDTEPFLPGRTVVTTTVEVCNQDPLTSTAQVTITKGPWVEILKNDTFSITLPVNSCESVEVPIEANLDNWGIRTTRTMTLTATSQASLGNATQVTEELVRGDIRTVYLPVAMGREGKLTAGVIAIGNGPQETLRTSMEEITKYVYQYLSDTLGMTPEEILALLQEPADLDGDGKPDSDMTDTTSEEFFLETEVFLSKHPGERVHSYLLGHGSREERASIALRCNSSSCPLDYKLYADEFNEWLERMIEQHNNKFVFVIESCHAGRPGGWIYIINGTPEHPNVILTSTDESGSWCRRNPTTGEIISFTTLFYGALDDGFSPQEAFIKASLEINYLFSQQVPLVEANGDGIPSSIVEDNGDISLINEAFGYKSPEVTVTSQVTLTQERIQELDEIIRNTEIYTLTQDPESDVGILINGLSQVNDITDELNRAGHDLNKQKALGNHKEVCLIKSTIQQLRTDLQRLTSFFESSLGEKLFNALRSNLKVSLEQGLEYSDVLRRMIIQIKTYLKSCSREEASYAKGILSRIDRTLYGFELPRNPDGEINRHVLYWHYVITLGWDLQHHLFV